MSGLKELVTTNEWVRNARQSVEVANAKSQNGTTYETLLKIIEFVSHVESFLEYILWHVHL